MRHSDATAHSSERLHQDAPPALRVLQAQPADVQATARAGLRSAPAGIVLRACRPRQWVKNALVVVAPAAAGVLDRPSVMARVGAALLAFSLLSSATYLVNDVRDRDQDRLHPRKRRRPIAAGELSVHGALRIAALLAALGLAAAVALGAVFAAVALVYLALTTSYSLLWRRVAFMDMLAIAAGFVVRAIAGGVAAGVPLSRSFLLVTSACAMFIVIGKRYAELAEAGARARARPTLRRYSGPLLRRLLLGSAIVGSVAYARWAFSRPDFGPWFELSMVPFVIWLGRYGMMLGAGAGQAPEDLILRDRMLLALSAIWAVLFVGGVYGTH